MTQHPKASDDSPRQAVIEITPEMVAAGIDAYAKWKPDDFAWQDTEDELVRRIFRAMFSGAAGGRDGGVV